MRVWACMHHMEEDMDPKVAGGSCSDSGSEPTSSAVAPPEGSEPCRVEEALVTPALSSHGPTQVLCGPRCVLVVVILLVLSLLGSWAVVHLSLGSRSNNGPFRVSSSYSQPGEQEAATYNPQFTTNCTMGKNTFALSMYFGSITCDWYVLL